MQFFLGLPFKGILFHVHIIGIVDSVIIVELKFLGFEVRLRMLLFVPISFCIELLTFLRLKRSLSKLSIQSIILFNNIRITPPWIVFCADRIILPFLQKLVEIGLFVLINLLFLIFLVSVGLEGPCVNVYLFSSRIVLFLWIFKNQLLFISSASHIGCWPWFVSLWESVNHIHA